jgi:hypothetical protein
MEIDELLKYEKAYGEGIQKGREMAIKNYDKLLLELCEKMQHIENKLDAFVDYLKRSQKSFNKTKELNHKKD